MRARRREAGAFVAWCVALQWSVVEAGSLGRLVAPPGGGMGKARRAPIGILIMPTGINLAALARTDAFARMRSVDVALLFTAGMAAGVALYLLVLAVRGE